MVMLTLLLLKYYASDVIIRLCTRGRANWGSDRSSRRDTETNCANEGAHFISLSFSSICRAESDSLYKQIN